MTRPRLVTGARLRYDDVREEHLLLVPEGAVRLNPSAAEVLELCDGERSVDDIVGVLSARYDGADLGDDVQELVDGIEWPGWVAHRRRIDPTDWLEAPVFGTLLPA